MASYGKAAKVGFIWGMVSRLSTEIVAVPASFVLARLLTPHDFGVAAIAGFFIQIAQRLTSFGFNTALVQVATITEAHAASVFVVNVALGVAAWLVLAAIAPLLAALYHSPDAGLVIPFATLAFVINSIGVVPSALLARQMKFKELSLIESSQAMASPIIAIPFAWAGFGYWSLVYALLIASAFPTLLKFAVSRWRPSVRFSLNALKELWSFGVGLHLKRTMDSAAANLDNLVVGRTLGIASLGLYDKAFTLMNRVVSFMSVVGPVVSISVLAKMQHDAVRFRAAFRKVLLSTTLVGYPLFAALAVMAQPLILLMFGRQWGASVLPFRILCVAGMLKLLATYVSSGMESKGRSWGAATVQAFYVAAIVIGVVVGSWWGLGGAAMGVLVATAIMAALMCNLLRSIAHLTWSDLLSPQWPGALCAVGIAVFVAGAGVVLRAGLGHEPPMLLQLAVQAVAGVVFYLTFLLWCRIAAVRDLLDETVVDFVPGDAGKRLRAWLARCTGKAPSAMDAVTP